MGGRINPVAAAVVLVVVIAIAGFLVYRATSPPNYTGPPINMGQMMKSGSTNGGGTGR